MPAQRIALGLIACCLLAGCKSNPTIASLFSRHKPDADIASAPVDSAMPESNFVLDQGMVVYWDAQPARTEPGQVKRGTAVVGPDGGLVVGPYGSCKVAGLTIDQAQNALAQHLSVYMATPRVRLSMTAAADSTTPEATDTAWRSAPASPADVQTVIWRHD